MLARLGGDEFALILGDVSAVQANRIANEMRAAICDDSMLAAMRSLHVSASIGVVFVDCGQHASAQDILVAADVAMYDAKKAGRNRVSLTLSVTEPKAKMKESLSWVERIRNALLHDRFILLAQPMLHLATNRIDRHELLLRMLDENGDVALPADFLPSAERFGLIGEINKWVVGEAVAVLRKVAELNRQVSFSINISASSLTDADVYAFIEKQLLRKRRIDPCSIIFEIKGTSAIADVEEAQRVMDRLRVRGCAFSLDDFGAGLNSFGYLKQLAFETVKIDSSFIQGIGDSATDRLMVEAMVQVVKGLGKETVAECVENERTLTIIRNAGITFAQGHHVGSPLKLADVSFDGVVLPG